MEELDILRYNDFKSFQSITEGNLSLQSEKTKNLYCEGGLRRLWLLCECLPYRRGSDHERHYGAGEYGQMRRLREVRKGVPHRCHRDSGGGSMRRRCYDYLWFVLMFVPFVYRNARSSYRTAGIGLIIRMSGKTSEFNSGDESEYLILPL